MHSDDPKLIGPEAVFIASLWALLIVLGAIGLSIAFYIAHQSHTAQSVVRDYIAHNANRDLLLNKTARYAHGSYPAAPANKPHPDAIREQLAESFALRPHRQRYPHKIEPGDTFLGPNRLTGVIASAQMTIYEPNQPIAERRIEVNLPFAFLVDSKTERVLGFQAAPRYGDIRISDPSLETPYTATADGAHPDDAISLATPTYIATAP